MIARVVFLFALIAGSAAVQDSVFIQILAQGESENNEVSKEAVSDAVVKIQDACKKGEDVALVAQSAAAVVVRATAKAVAASGIVARTTGRGVGTALAAVNARSTATAIAKAIATALAEINNGPEVKAASEAMIEDSKYAVAGVQQALEIGGDAEAVAVAAAEAEVFVSAVAAALSAAAGACDGDSGEGAVVAGTQTATAKEPEEATPEDSTDTVAVSGGNIGANGFVNILRNSAVSQIFQGMFGI